MKKDLTREKDIDFWRDKISDKVRERSVRSDMETHKFVSVSGALNVGKAV